MRSKTAKWFECKVRYEQVQPDGTAKKVTEMYVVDALSFSEAERRITEEMLAYISGEFEVVGIKPAQYCDVQFVSAEQQENADTRWYKAKLQFITIDEKTGKEKKQNVTYLVQGRSLRNALDNVDKVMKGTMIDYIQANVGETQIIDVFEHEESNADGDGNEQQ